MLHFVVYCSLVTFSFSIFSVYLHTVLMAFIVYSNWIFFGTLLAFVGVTPTSCCCHAIRDCLLILYVYVYVYACMCMYVYIYVYVYVYIYIYIYIYIYMCVYTLI